MLVRWVCAQRGPGDFPCDHLATLDIEAVRRVLESGSTLQLLCNTRDTETMRQAQKSTGQLYCGAEAIETAAERTRRPPANVEIETR